MKVYETVSNRRTANSYSKASSEIENDDYNNHTGNSTECLQFETSVEPNTNPTDNTQKHSLRITQSPFSEIFTGQKQNPSVKWQQQISEVFSSEQAQTEIEHLRLRYQRRIKATNQLLRKQQLECNQLIQQLYQLHTELHHHTPPSETIQVIPQTSKGVAPQQVARCEFSIPTPFVFHYRKTKASIYYGCS